MQRSACTKITRMRKVVICVVGWMLAHLQMCMQRERDGREKTLFHTNKQMDQRRKEK